MISPDDMYDIGEATKKLSDRLVKLNMTKHPPTVSLSVLANHLVILAQSAKLEKELFLTLCELTWDGQAKFKEENDNAR